MIVKRPAQVGELHEPRQFVSLRGLDLTEPFPQLRRDEAQFQRGEQFPFTARDETFPLLRFFFRCALAVRRHEAPFTETKPGRERALPQLDIMVLRTGEMMQRKNELPLGHDSQIRLQTTLKPHARLRFTLSGDLFHARLRDKPLHDWTDLVRRHDEIQIADRLHSPP